MDEKVIFEENSFTPLPDDERGLNQHVAVHTSYWKDVWRSFRKNKAATVSLIVLIIMVFFVLFGPMMNEFDYASNNYDKLDMAPNAEHWFGTDGLGRDLWTRVWQGGRVSLLIALAATIIPYLIGLAVGGISGYAGGKVDMFIMRAIDVLMGIPSLIYTILLMMVFKAGNVITLIIAMSVTGWMESARMTRALVIQMRNREFVVASETLGVSPGKIIFRHLIPNTLGIIIVGMTMYIPNVIFNEAFLSFIGLGVTPPQPSWGQLIKIAAENFRYYPYQFIIPCACLSITMLCFNLLGDGLRDALDPKLRG